MSVENTKKFLAQLKEDEALQERTANKGKDEVLAVAKEMGLAFTLDELKEAIDDDEINPDELESAAGGKFKGSGGSGHVSEYCPANPTDHTHNWVKYGHEVKSADSPVSRGMRLEWQEIPSQSENSIIDQTVR